MPRFTATEAIPAPASAVFDVISDLATHPQWAADDLVLERTGERTWRSVSRARGRTFHADLIVTVLEPDRVFEFIASDETGTYRHNLSIEHAPGGCAVTRTVTAERLGAAQTVLYWVTLFPVRRPALQTSLAKLSALLA